MLSLHGGGIFLRRTSREGALRTWRSQAEVINDISTDVTTLFRVLQRHYVPFMDMLRWQITSRTEFERLRAANPETLTDLERAARFLYLQRTSFGGKVAHRHFGVSPGTPARFDISKLGSLLEAVHERLTGVVIERLPYAELLPRYDRPGTLFYLDPPYWGCEEDYGAGIFAPSDFTRLAWLLAALKGPFLLSLNDHPGVRVTFAGFTMEEITTTYSIGSRSRSGVGELLITNRP